MAKGYTAYVLTETSREKLLRMFPPKYTNVVAHHVTWEFGVSEFADLPPIPSKAQIIGIADDCRGVEALLVNVDSNIERPDGKSMHVTWSLAEGRKPVESNDIIDAGHFELIRGRIFVELEPRFIPFGK